MNGALGAFLAGSAHGFAVDGDNIRGHTCYRGHPGDKAALELFSIQGGENIAEVVVGRRAILERAKPAQQGQLFGSEQRGFGEAFGPGQHGEQA